MATAKIDNAMIQLGGKYVFSFGSEGMSEQTFTTFILSRLK